MKITAFCNKGGRKYMEDLFSVAYQQTADLTNLEFAFFGIFDGHGGVEAAKYAKEYLMKNIISQKNFYSDDDEEVLKAIREGYLLTHQGMWKNLDNWPKTSSGLPSTAGTTASVAFIRHGKIYIGHVGDSAIVLGVEDEVTKTWKAKALTEDHKPECSVEKERITNSGGKVVVKSGVPRVVWNRPKIGHKGPIRRSTPIDEIPFLAVARSLGDLWSYNSALDEFVVSPNPDVCVIKIDSNFKCLIFGTDGLWNVCTADDAVDLVRKVDFSNETMMNGGSSQEWLNPSRCLVEQALNNWNKTRMRADNTSCVTVMLDPTNKKNLIKFGNTTLNMHGTYENNNVANHQTAEQLQLHQQATTTADPLHQTYEDRNMTMFDYSTREAFNLEQISSSVPSAISLENRVSADSYMFDSSFSSSVYQANGGEYYGDSLLHTSLTHEPYTGSPSTSRLENVEMHEYHPNYSLHRLQSRHERENQQMCYSKRYLPAYPHYGHAGPSSLNYHHTTAPQPQPEMNVLPSIHNFVSDHHKYSMERFDYVNYGHYHHIHHHYHHHNNNEIATTPPPTIQEDYQVFETATPEPKNDVNDVNDEEGETSKMSLEDSIQINEISSSFSDENVSRTAEESASKVAKSKKKAQAANKKRIFYETRLTKSKPRSCNSIYSQKNVSTPILSRKKIIKKKLTARQPAVVATLTKKLENALETTIGKLKLKRKMKIVATNKENNDSQQHQPILRSLRNSIRICNNNVVAPADSPVLKQTQSPSASLKRKTAFDNTNIANSSTRTNSKLRKLK